jgi:hypothetical protein
MTMELTPKTPETEVGRQARQQYLTLAREVIGEEDLDYTTLYQRFAENDWAAIKLDDAVALQGLKAGFTPKEVAVCLLQSPYIQHQIHHNRVPAAPMTQYAKGTVIKMLQQLRVTQSAQQGVSRQRPQRQSGMELE